MPQCTVLHESMAYAWRLEAHGAMNGQTDTYRFSELREAPFPRLRAHGLYLHSRVYLVEASLPESEYYVTLSKF